MPRFNFSTSYQRCGPPFRVPARAGGPPPAGVVAAKVQTTPGAELHADVPDVRPFLARAGFLIVPLRIGGGSRLKILEALAAGTPVVSTQSRCGRTGTHFWARLDRCGHAGRVGERRAECDPAAGRTGRHR